MSKQQGFKHDSGGFQVSSCGLDLPYPFGTAETPEPCSSRDSRLCRRRPHVFEEQLAMPRGRRLEATSRGSAYPGRATVYKRKACSFPGTDRLMCLRQDLQISGRPWWRGAVLAVEVVAVNRRLAGLLLSLTRRNNGRTRLPAFAGIVGGFVVVCVVAGSRASSSAASSKTVPHGSFRLLMRSSCLD